MSTLTCPKCHGQMRNYERSGVHVDQCTECRGIFLDRGELERLMDAEQAHYGGGASPGAAPSHAPSYPPPPAPSYAPPHAPSHSYDPRRNDDYYKKHKRKGFLSDIFDFD